jgi:hypothetical protein
MNKIFSAILVISTLLVFALTGCQDATSTNPPVSYTPASETLTEIDATVIDFVKNTAIFKFDGIQDSLSFTKSDYCPISSCRAVEYIVKFQNAHPGYGDRTGQILAAVITSHTAKVYYDQDKKKIFSAECDNTWDLVNDRALPIYISGYVVSGGDTVQPGGPLDVPHVFKYLIKKKDGTQINLSYTAYPPSPMGDIARANMTLDFYAGSIQIGDQITASGFFDQATNTLIINAQGGSIRTEIPKLQAVGKIISGGDTTPPGFLDAPRKFVYTLQKDDKSTIDAIYTVYPPSPAGSVNNAKLSLTLYDGAPKIGDYMMVYGTFDVVANTITAIDTGDIIKTYPLKP